MSDLLQVVQETDGSVTVYMGPEIEVEAELAARLDALKDLVNLDAAELQRRLDAIATLEASDAAALRRQIAELEMIANTRHDPFDARLVPIGLLRTTTPRAPMSWCSKISTLICWLTSRSCGSSSLTRTRGARAGVDDPRPDAHPVHNQPAGAQAIATAVPSGANDTELFVQMLNDANQVLSQRRLIQAIGSEGAFAPRKSQGRPTAH